MTNNISKKMLKARLQDYLLCAAVLFLSIFWLTDPTGAAGAAPGSAVLRHGGVVLARLPLDRASRRVFGLESGAIAVEVAPGKGVRISESNCPAKVCMHHGWAQAAGETIACIPNRLLVEIEGEKSEYDAVIR